MNRRCAATVLALLLSLFAAGCFDIEQSVVLTKEMSGKASYRMGIDFEPVAQVVVQLQRSMQGKTGPATAEELAQVRSDLLKKMDETPSDPNATRASLAKSLPDGVSLLDYTMTQNGLKLVSTVVYGFDDPKRLALIEMVDAKKPGANPETARPFQGFDVKDDGKTFVITSLPADPTQSAKEGAKQAGDAPDVQAMVRQALKGMRMTFRVEAPFDVVETNATRKEGKTLVWEYSLDSLERIQHGEKGLGVFVRYRKPA